MPKPEYQDAPSKSLQQGLLTLLIWSDPASGKIRQKIDPNLFTTDVYRNVVSRCFEYIDKYGRAPKHAMGELLHKELRGKDAEMYAELINDARAANAGTDPTFWLDHLDGFIQTQILKLGVIRASEAIQAGNTDEALATLRPIVEAKGKRAINGHAHIQLQKGSDIKPRTIRWLWDQRIPRGKLTMVVGDPGHGKSTLLLDLAARVTSGRAWPDGVPGEQAKTRVIFMSSEDDAADTLLPRFKAMGGNPDLIFFKGMVERRDRKTGVVGQSEFSLADVEPLKTAITDLGRWPRVGLVVIDPISTSLAGADANANAQVRALLAPIIRLASEQNFALVVISHLNKDQQKAIQHRTVGSIAWNAAARAVYGVGPDPENEPENERDLRRLFVRIKCNIAPPQPGLSYRIGSKQIRELPGSEQAIIEWDDAPVTLTAEEVFGPKQSRDGSSQRANVETHLKEMLADGPIAAKEAEAQLEAEGYSKDTIYRARQSLGIKSERQRDGFVWSMPSKGKPKFKTKAKSKLRLARR